MKRVVVLFLVGLVAFVLLTPIDGAAASRDTVSFTLTFADRSRKVLFDCNTLKYERRLAPY